MPELTEDQLTEKPGAFLGFENTSLPSSRPQFSIIPFGLEKTVTFGSGTSKGPDAILEASQEVELFDFEYKTETCRQFNFETLPHSIPKKRLEEALDQLEEIVTDCVKIGHIPITLGGEHSLTPAAVRPFAEEFEKLTIVQFDAHADLRDGYLGQHYSHASAIRRCLDFENVDVVAIGIRNMGIDEHEYLKSSSRITMYDALSSNWIQVNNELKSILAGKNVYLTFDLDGLDPSIMPATGTPEPGGLDWQSTMMMMRSIASVANIHGADIVELAPITGMHSPDFIAAQLVYKMMGHIALA